MKKISFNFKSTNKKDTIKGLYYLPEDIKGILFMVHGKDEKISQYDQFMRYIASKNYIAIGIDLLGHGESASLLGHFGDNDGYHNIINDVYVAIEYIYQKYPDFKIDVVGHGMGSLILRNIMIHKKYNKLIGRVVLIGSPYKYKKIKLSICICKLIVKCSGAKKYSNYLENKIKKYKLVKDNDTPVVHHQFTNQAHLDLLYLFYYANNENYISKYPLNYTLFLTGSEDPVTNYASGTVRIVKDMIDKQKNVSFRVFQNSGHDILNGPNKQDVYDKIYDFIIK